MTGDRADRPNRRPVKLIQSIEVSPERVVLTTYHLGETDPDALDMTCRLSLGLILNAMGMDCE